MPILIHVVAAALYAAAAWTRWPAARPAARGAAAAWLPPVALAVHAIALVLARSRRRRASTSRSRTRFRWSRRFACWSHGRRASCARCPAVAAIVLPVAAVAALLPALVTQSASLSLRRRALGRRAHRGRAARVRIPARRGDHRAADDRSREATAPRTSAGRRRQTPPLLTLERYLFRLVGAGLRAADADARERRAVLRAGVRQAVHAHAQEPVLDPRLADVRRACSPAAGASDGAAARRRTGSSPARRCWCSPTSAASSCSRCLLGPARPNAEPTWTTSR